MNTTGQHGDLTAVPDIGHLVLLVLGGWAGLTEEPQGQLSSLLHTTYHPLPRVAGCDRHLPSGWHKEVTAHERELGLAATIVYQGERKEEKRDAQG